MTSVSCDEYNLQGGVPLVTCVAGWMGRYGPHYLGHVAEM